MGKCLGYVCSVFKDELDSGCVKYNFKMRRKRFMTGQCVTF